MFISPFDVVYIRLGSYGPGYLYRTIVRMDPATFQLEYIDEVSKSSKHPSPILPSNVLTLIYSIILLLVVRYDGPFHPKINTLETNSFQTSFVALDVDAQILYFIYLFNYFSVSLNLIVLVCLRYSACNPLISFY